MMNVKEKEITLENGCWSRTQKAGTSEVFQDMPEQSEEPGWKSSLALEQVSQISGYLDTWENVNRIDDKRRVVDLMITTESGGLA